MAYFRSAGLGWFPTLFETSSCSVVRCSVRRCLLAGSRIFVVVGALLDHVMHLLDRVGQPSSTNSFITNMIESSCGVAVVVVEHYKISANVQPSVVW